jgi:hypothetical protein
MSASEVCARLRWKGHHASMPDALRRKVFARNAVPYTCLETGQPWGPCEEPAAPELCVRGRSCFQSNDPSGSAPPDAGRER